MIAIAVSGNRPQRPPGMSMRMPQMSAMTASSSGTVIDMATSVCKRVPRSCRRRARAPGRSVERGQQTIDRGQTGVEDVWGPTEADPQMALGAELRARNDHRRVLVDQAVDEDRRIDRVAVAEEADRAGGGRGPVKLARPARRPLLEPRPALVEQKTRALEKLIATLQGDLREHLGNGRRGDRGVVLELERGGDALARTHHPTNSQTGEPVDLRETARDHDALGSPAEAGALLARALGAAVHLVGEDPRAVAIRDPHDRGD